MSLNKIYFPRKALYEKPSYEKYAGKMAEFYASQWPAYPYQDSESLLQKHQLLLVDKFQKFVPASDREKYYKFIEKRKNSLSAPSVLSWRETIKFFENFYFLLENQDDSYQLSDRDKERLVKVIADVYTGRKDVCEPGLVTRFNEILTLHRKDTQWIAVELHKQRWGIVRRLAEEFNAQHLVPDILSPHTVMYMQSLSQMYALGVEPDCVIEDIYYLEADQEQARAYFVEHYQTAFLNYEQHLLEGLLAYLYASFSELGLTKNADDLIILDGENKDIFDNFWSLFFPDLNEFRPELYHEFSQEITGSGGVYQYALIPESEWASVLKKCLQATLDMGYFLTISSDTLVSEEQLSEIHFVFQHDFSNDDLLYFFNAIQGLSRGVAIPQGSLEDFLKKYQLFLEAYPNIWYFFVVNNPTFWDFLPKKVKNNRKFIEYLISCLNAQYLDENEIPADAIMLFKKILKVNRSFFASFSPKLQDKLREIGESSETGFVGVLTLLKTFQLSHIAAEITPWQLLASYSLEGKQAQNYAIRAGFSLKALKKFIMTLEHNFDDVEGLWTQQGYLQIQSVIAGHTASQQNDNDRVYSKQFYQKRLQRAIVENLNWFDAFLQFQSEIPIFDFPFSMQQQSKFIYYCLRRLFHAFIGLSYATLKFFIAVALWFLCDFLAEKRNIFLDFVVSNPNLFWIGIVCSLIIFLCNYHELQQTGAQNPVMLFLQVTQFVFTPLFFLAPEELAFELLYFSAFSVIFYMTCSIVLAYNRISGDGWDFNGARRIAGNVVAQYFLMDLMLGYRACLFLYSVVNFIFNLCINLDASIRPLLAQGWQQVKWMLTGGHQEQLAAAMCLEEVVFRLSRIDDVSAQQKASVLSLILDAMKTENRVDHAVDVSKKHLFFWNGVQHQLSYYEVSSIKRQSGKPFDLQAKPSFFKSCYKTDSEKLLRPAFMTVSG